jgi:GT2 family glycosyltransferase
MDKVYILLLNYRGWRNTIECLESVFRLSYPSYRVIVVDNASGDGSLDRILQWASGREPAEIPRGPLRRFSEPPVLKPISTALLDLDAARQGRADADVPLTIISADRNLGYAGGSNISLSYVLAAGDASLVWLINNDTVVDPEALAHLVQRMRAVPDAGACGSTILSYDHPDEIETRGGLRYNAWLGTCLPIGKGRPGGEPLDRDRVERQMSAVQGASVLVRTEFLRDVGLMSEDYFFYFDEIDWAVRGRDRYSLAYAPESRVYHKGGGTLTQTSPLSCYYDYRARVVFTRKFYPRRLPLVLLRLALTAARRVLEGDGAALGTLRRAVSDGLAGRPAAAP